MKKITLIVVSLLITLFSYSQSIDRVVKSMKSEWNGNEWKTIATNYPKELFIVTKEWEIRIGDYLFKTYDTPEKNTYENHVCYTWKCVNAEGKKCLFMMKKFNPDITSNILYSIVYDTGVMYEYVVEKN